MRITHACVIVCSGVAAVASSMLTTHALADVIAADFTDGSNYHYQIVHMPDIDQRRTALPGGGSMYCAPAAAMNLFAYIANHGFPNQGPGAFNYQAAMMFDYTTLMLELLGSANFMNTSATGGTSGTGIIDGLNAWLHPDWFTWNYQFAAGTYAPSQIQFTQSAINGSLVMYCFGRYSITGFNGSVPVLNRDSGHCVTLSRSFRAGNTRWTWVRDPGRDNGDPNVQSLFANTLHDNLANFTVQVGTQQRSMLSINWPQSDNRYRLIDSWVRISAKQGYSFTNTGVQVMNPFAFPGSDVFVTHNASHDGATINNALISLEGNHIWSLQTEPNGLMSLYMYDVNSQESERIIPATGAKALVFGRKRGLYLLMPQVIGLYDVDQTPPVSIGAATLTQPADAMTYDDRQDHVVLLLIGAREILRYMDNLAGAPIRYTIPPGVPMGGAGQIVVNPMDDSMWFRTNAFNGLFRATPAINLKQGEQLVVEQVPINFSAIRSFDIDSAGNLFVIDDGNVREFRPVQGGYDEVQSAYAGFPIGNDIQIARNRTNFDPALHDGPGWDNTPPEELFDAPSFTDCFVDIAPQPVADGVVNVNDLLALINSWGPCGDPNNCLADIAPIPGGDGVVNASDLLLVLNNWGACP